MAVIENVKFELGGRFQSLNLGKTHLSVRYEPASRIVRIGACVSSYDWDTRAAVVDALLDFEESHAEDYAVEFDVIPLEAVNDETFADA